VITGDNCTPCSRRESIEDIRPDRIIPHRQTQRLQPQPDQHLPSTRRARETPGLLRSRWPGHADFATLQPRLAPAPYIIHSPV